MLEASSQWDHAGHPALLTASGKSILDHSSVQMELEVSPAVGATDTLHILGMMATTMLTFLSWFPWHLLQRLSLCL